MFKAGDKVRFKRLPRNWYGEEQTAVAPPSEMVLGSICSNLGNHDDFTAWYVQGSDWGWVRSDDIEKIGDEPSNLEMAKFLIEDMSADEIADFLVWIDQKGNFDA